jgi:hypothetical protein
VRTLQDRLHGLGNHFVALVFDAVAAMVGDVAAIGDGMVSVIARGKEVARERRRHFLVGKSEIPGIRSAIDDVADDIAGPGARYCGEVFHVGKKSGANVWVNLKSAVT